MVWWSRHHRHCYRSMPAKPYFPCRWSLSQRAALVNVKMKWVKDRPLDSVVSREKHLRPAHHLLEEISQYPQAIARADSLSTRLPNGLAASASAFACRFPSLFTCSHDCVRLTDGAASLREEELRVLHESEGDIVDRLRKLLMMTRGRSLPFHTIEQLRWDMGLPRDYRCVLVPRFPGFFRPFQPDGDERIWLELLHWDKSLAVSRLQETSEEGQGDNLPFPVSFTRGFGLKRKCAAWLREWQTLPYTSPYADASGLDVRTDVSEKRIVGVFHELLHLTLAKKTERQSVSNLRKPLGLPQKFTKVFERHPGIFYVSRKLATHTVVLREAYCGRRLLTKHPLVEIRERYAAMMREGTDKSESSEEEEMLEDDDEQSDRRQ